MICSRNEAVAQILLIMKDWKIGPDEISQRMSFYNFGFEHERYDLLCTRANHKVRLPFELGKRFNPIGIFPFKDASIYLETGRYPLLYPHEVNKEKLPTVGFFMRVSKLGGFVSLNRCLHKLTGCSDLYNTFYAKDAHDKLCVIRLYRLSDNNALSYLAVSEPSKNNRAFACYIGLFND